MCQHKEYTLVLRVLNEKIKKGQNVSISGIHCNQSSNTIAKLEKKSLNLPTNTTVQTLVNTAYKASIQTRKVAHTLV